MHPDTHLVIQLQSLDQRIAALEKEVAALPKHIAGDRKDPRIARAQARSRPRRPRRQSQGPQKAGSRHPDPGAENLQAPRPDAGAKTNEQYRAFQHEIEFIEKEIRKSEDRILDLMSESEPLDQNVRKAEIALKEEKHNVESEKTLARERTASDQAELDTASRRARRGFGQTAALHQNFLRADSQEMARPRGRRSRRGSLFRMPDRDSPAAHAGSENGRRADGVRKLRPLPDLQSSGPHRRRRPRRLAVSKARRLLLLRSAEARPRRLMPLSL